MPGPLYIGDVDEKAPRVVLEGLTILFHPASSMTHILAPPSPEILAVLAEPGDAHTVVARLSAQFDLTDESVVEAVAARLAELAASGLVRPA